jgi:hypothetical protein
MTFEGHMKIGKDNLARPQDFDRQTVLNVMKKSYFAAIEGLIKTLNECQDAERSKILKKIKEADKVYLDAIGMEITGHVLFSRHGQCDKLVQKRLGLSPNTPITENSEQSMGTTNQSTHALLFYDAKKKPPYIAISPMNRALQTASLLIPDGIKNANISVETALTENSSAPSGFDVRSTQDLQKLSDQTSFWESPLQKILLIISMWFYTDKDFEKLYEKRKAAAEKIQTYGSTILNHGEPEHPDVQQNLDYTGNKIEDTKVLMENADQRDCWFFGHGKNFQAFFSEVLGIKSSFDYAETRSVYKVKDGGDASSLFSPPYVLTINQDTGKIEGKYTALVGQSIVGKKAISQEEVEASGENTPLVSKAMTRLGPSIPQQRDPLLIKKSKGIASDDSLSISEQQHEALESERSHLLS